MWCLTCRENLDSVPKVSVGNPNSIRIAYREVVSIGGRVHRIIKAVEKTMKTEQRWKKIQPCWRPPLIMRLRSVVHLMQALAVRLVKHATCHTMKRRGRLALVLSAAVMFATPDDTFCHSRKKRLSCDCVQTNEIRH